MSGITLAQAQAQLATWLEADTMVASGQSYEIAGRKLTRADAATITEKIEYWDKKVTQLTPASRGRGRARTIMVR